MNPILVVVSLFPHQLIKQLSNMSKIISTIFRSTQVLLRNNVRGYCGKHGMGNRGPIRPDTFGSSAKDRLQERLVSRENRGQANEKPGIMSVCSSILYHLTGRETTSLGKPCAKVLLDPVHDDTAEGAGHVVDKMVGVVNVSYITAIAVLHGEELWEV